MIRYLKHSEIDFELWNECVSQSPHSLLYGYSWFLDIAADNWDALVLDDYDAVMPLPWRKKNGFYYLYQPEMMQQGGLFSRGNLSAELLSDFIHSIPSRFRLVEIMFNYANNFDIEGLVERQNLIIDLNYSIAELRNDYSDNTRRNIKKAVKEGLSIHYHFNMNEIMQLFAENRGAELRISDFWKNRIMAITHTLHHKGLGHCISLFNKTNQCVAGAFYVFFEQRVYFLFSGSGKDAKKFGAMHLLVDSLIEKFAGTLSVFDFEGSNNEGLARFYKGFGAVSQNYPIFKINRLPCWIKWVKS